MAGVGNALTIEDHRREYGDHPGDRSKYASSGALSACAGILRSVRRERTGRVGGDPVYHDAHERRTRQYAVPDGRTGCAELQSSVYLLLGIVQ